jgi:hypothetical protein
MEIKWGTIGSIGGLCLAGYLIFVGISMLFGLTAIPAWFIGLVALSAGVLILIGR